jgi:hypothetical protein
VAKLQFIHEVVRETVAGRAPMRFGSPPPPPPPPPPASVDEAAAPPAVPS